MALFGEDRPRVLVERVENASISSTVKTAACCSADIGTIKAILVECRSGAPKARGANSKPVSSREPDEHTLSGEFTYDDR
jgi:hypothetical protein